MTIVAAPLLLLLVSQAPTLGLSLRPGVGLRNEEVAALRGKVAAEASAFGLSVVAVPALDGNCVGDVDCVEEGRVKAGSADRARRNAALDPKSAR